MNSSSPSPPWEFFEFQESFNLLREFWRVSDEIDEHLLHVFLWKIFEIFKHNLEESAEGIEFPKLQGERVPMPHTCSLHATGLTTRQMFTEISYQRL